MPVKIKQKVTKYNESLLSVADSLLPGSLNSHVSLELTLEYIYISIEFTIEFGLEVSPDWFGMFAWKYRNLFVDEKFEHKLRI